MHLRHPLIPAVLLVGLLLLGLPLFLRMPIWVDTTYHDVSAWNILHGGVHYRDVFETNLPGLVWVHAVLRPLIGWSHEAIRIADFLVVTAILYLLSLIMKRQGVSLAGRLWFFFAAYLFYLFESEFIHCQRDGWMLLPACAAVYLRFRRIQRAAVDPARSDLFGSLLEGALWGCAVWIKPHCFVPAVLVWLVSLRYQPQKAAMRDTLAVLGGGIVVGAIGSIWLIATGTWGPMWEVLLHWNGEYYKWSLADVFWKCQMVFSYFAPFSVLHFAALPLAIYSMVDRRQEHSGRALLAALYFGWLAQATLVQKGFDYAHSPPVILAIALLACWRLPVGQVLLIWCLIGASLNQLFPQVVNALEEKRPATGRIVLPVHPALQASRLQYWPRCWYDDSWELKDRLTHFDNIHCTPNWEELAQVEAFLRTLDLQDRDLICWHDSTHPLYVRLGIKPGFRFPHVMTSMKFRSKLPVLQEEAFHSPARYIVSDLVPVDYLHKVTRFPTPGPANSLPKDFPEWGPSTYPWNQPVVFQAGRFFVHRVDHPHGQITFPLPEWAED
jgi:hypothetical protein